MLIDRGDDFVGAGEIITLLRGQRQVLIEKPKFSGPEIKYLGANAKDTAAPETPAP